MTRTLTLKSERLTELTGDELLVVVAANGAAQGTMITACPNLQTCLSRQDGCASTNPWC